jgi:hypothetical protein
LPFRFARGLRVRLIIRSGIVECHKVIGDRVFETSQRVLHTRRGARLRNPGLMAGEAKKLGYLAFAIAGA